MYKKLIAIGIGSVFVSIGINVFILPLQLVTGGITGISLIINYLLGYKVGVMIFCLNLPIYLLALGFNPLIF
ncbi:YitT family protein [Priestia megaterium]|uniref:YitT family protein n=1 Tax=Priestia megaterium TaxID=1404 RepID=UPI003000338A